MDDSWCILRCQGRATLRLTDTLAKDGYEVWTPRETRRITIPKFNVRRSAVLPLLPSYVFAKSAHLIDLLELANTQTFSVMHYHDRIPLVADKHLTGLRTLEARRTPLKKGQPLTPGVDVKVRIEGGSYAGMNGKVERSNEGWTLICIDKRRTVKIATTLLELSEPKALAA